MSEHEHTVYENGGRAWCIECDSMENLMTEQECQHKRFGPRMMWCQDCGMGGDSIIAALNVKNERLRQQYDDWKTDYSLLSDDYKQLQLQLAKANTENERLGRERDKYKQEWRDAEEREAAKEKQAKRLRVALQGLVSAMDAHAPKWRELNRYDFTAAEVQAAHEALAVWPNFLEEPDA